MATTTTTTTPTATYAWANEVARIAAGTGSGQRFAVLALAVAELATPEARTVPFAELAAATKAADPKGRGLRQTYTPRNGATGDGGRASWATLVSRGRKLLPEAFEGVRVVESGLYIAGTRAPK